MCPLGRAHLLGGESPLLARQGEELAKRQCRKGIPTKYSRFAPYF